MVNTCEPVQRPSLRTSQSGCQAWPKGTEAGGGFSGATSWSGRLPVDSRYLTPHILLERNVETPYLPCKGRRTARRADGGAGLGCRKKRIPSCNGADTGLNVTRHESEPTSDRCLFARACGEHLKRGKQWETEVVRPPVCAPPPLAGPELVPAMLAQLPRFSWSPPGKAGVWHRLSSLHREGHLLGCEPSLDRRHDLLGDAEDLVDEPVLRLGRGGSADLEQMAIRGG